MKLKAIIALAFGFLMAADALKADASSVPEGHQHVALFTQCHGSIENQPVIIESKPATFLMGIG
jgi:hypothetical protein